MSSPKSSTNTVSDSERTAATSCSTITRESGLSFWFDDLAEHGQQVLRRLHVETGKRLVEEKNPRLTGEGAAHLDQAGRHPEAARPPEPWRRGSAAASRAGRRCGRSRACRVATANAGSNMSRQRRTGDTRARCASTKCSRTVRPMKSSGCWNVRARPRPARDRGEAPLTSSPPSQTRPALHRCRPESTPSSVDFPAPFGPTRPAMDPLATSIETSESAVSPPKRTVTPWAAMATSVRRQHRARARVAVVPVVTKRPRPRAARVVRSRPHQRSGRCRRSARAPSRAGPNRSRKRRRLRPFSARTPSGYLAAEIAPSAETDRQPVGRFVICGQ